MFPPTGNSFTSANICLWAKLGCSKGKQYICHTGNPAGEGAGYVLKIIQIKIPNYILFVVKRVLSWSKENVKASNSVVSINVLKEKSRQACSLVEI